MDRLKFLYTGLFFLLNGILLMPLQLTATVKRWNGSASSDWNDLLNWTPAGPPGEGDEVILDNNFITGDYTLRLPDSTIKLYSLSISPANGSKIQLTIPASNKQAPALSLSSFILLDAGAIFKNSSGLTSGQSLSIGGKLVIRNGGLYSHNTRASHASGIIAKLSTDAGTERGEFEFDVPGGAYSLSLSNRNYGTLRLLASASDGSQTYNATGSSVSNIRGNLEINRGVVCNLDLEKTLTIEGDFIQSGGVFNIASQPNNLQVIIKGTALQNADATITESSTGLPVIAFEGSSRQQLSMYGSCLNSVGVLINNPWGIYLNTDFLIPYSLQFKSGKIQSSSSAMLKIADHATVSGASDQSFVDGPVLKMGAEDFEFPIGRQGDFAPLKLSGASGTSTERCIAQYNHGNPQLMFGTRLESSSVLRISTLEYWTVERNSPAPTGKITLAVGPYSHATSLEKLVITNWDKDKQLWKDCGNSSYSGIASGTVTSNLTPVSGIYTVGTTVQDQNPLPVYFEALKGLWVEDEVTLSWKAHNQQVADRYVIEFSDDGFDFRQVDVIDADSLTSDYVYRKIVTRTGVLYCRVILLAGGVKMVQSQEVQLQPTASPMRVNLYPVPAHDILHVSIVSAKMEKISLQIIGVAGRPLVIWPKSIHVGENIFDLPVHQLIRGFYILRIINVRGRVETFPFLKF